ncbi:MAG: PAS domain-containing protein [Dongiaceae bacterium]
MSTRDASWRFEQCRFLYSGMPGAIAISSVVALILAAAQSEVVAPVGTIVWLAAIGAVGLARIALWRRNRRAPARKDESEIWLRRYRIGAFSAGLTWALGSYLLFPTGDLRHQAFLAFAVAGICAAAAIAQAADRISPMLFASPPLVTLIALQLLEGEMLALSMGAMTLLFFVFILVNAVRSQERLRALSRYRSAAMESGAQLASSEARLHHLLSAGPAVIYSCDITGDFPATYVSPNIAGMMGYSADEFLAVPSFWARHVHPDDIAPARAMQSELLERGRVNLEYRFHHKNGEWRWTRDDQIVIRDANGAPREIIGAWTDITARRAAEETAKAQSKLQRIVAEISAMLINTHRGGLDDAINDALRKIGTFFGVERGHVFLFSPEREAFDNTHEWCAVGIAPQIEALCNVAARSIPRLTERLRRGGILQLADAADTAADAAADLAALGRQDVRSLIALPMTRQGEFIGFLGFDSISRARSWSDDEISLLKVMADVIAGALSQEQAATALADTNAWLERRVAERTAALSASEQRLARAQRAARLGSWEYDPGTREWHWSEEFYRIFGLDPSASRTPDAWLPLVHPDDRAWVPEALSKGRESHRPYEIQCRIIRPDGRLRIIRTREEEEEDGKRVGSVMDVTEQAQAEQALADARRIARLGGWEWNAATAERWWSAEMYDILGVDPDTFNRNSEEVVAALIHPDDRARVVETWRRTDTEGYAQTFRIRRPDGAVIVCEERGELLSGNRWAGSLMDITDLVRTEEKLAEAQRIAHLGNWESNEQTGELRWSDEVFRIFGLEPGAIAPTIAWVEAHIHPEDRERVIRTWNPPDDSTKRYEQEYRIVRPNGEVRWVAEIGEPAESVGIAGMSYVGTLLDITERMLAERNLAEAQKIAKTGSWEMLPEREENRWSEELYRLLGLQRGRDAALDSNWNALIHPEDRDAVIAAYLAANKQQKSYEIRYRLTRPDGELRYMAERGEWIDGRFVGTLSDITEQERVQRSLAVAQHIASTGSWEYHPETDDHWWSDEMYHLLGLVREEIASNDTNWDMLIHPDDRAAARAAYLGAYDHHTGYEIRYRLVRPDGETRFMMERGAWIDGRFSGTLTDISEEERVKRALAEAQRIAATGSWEFRPGSATQWWSDEMYRLFGLTRDMHASTGDTWHARIHPQDRIVAAAAERVARERREPYEIRYRLMRPNGETRFAIERGEWIDDRFTGTLSDITEQERTQRSLAEAHRIAKVGSWEWIPGTKLLRWSEEALRIFAYDDGIAQRNNRDWQMRVHPDDLGNVEATLAANRERGIPFELAYRIVLPHGEIRTIHERIESELDGAGRLIREVGIFQDVTESKQLELAMQALSTELIALEGAAYFTAAAERLTKLLHVEHAYIARMDPAHPGALRTVAAIGDGKSAAGDPDLSVGTPAAELAAGRSVLIDRGARARYPADVRLASDAIEGYAGEPIGDHDGRVIGQLAVMSRRPLPDAATVQTILRMFGVGAAAAIGRERIHQRDAWLRAILDNTPSAIVLKDLDLRVMAVSRKDAAEHGLTPDDVIGTKTGDLFPPDLAEVYESADRKVIATGQPIRQDVVEKQNGRIRHIQNVKFPMRDEDGRIIGVCSISDDLTEVKQVEAQLAHAQKMEAIGALTGGMAHDFNNYLAVIIGNLEILRQDVIDDPSAVALIDAALRGATRSEELTRSLLAFARRQPLAPTIVNIAERIEETARLLERTLGEDIVIKVSIAPGLWPALVDGGQLASCIVNLANNARDAMPDGGRLGISARNEHVDRLYEALSPDVAPGDYVLIEVADSGIGMKPEVLANALEPFFTTKGPGHGTGLGLSMVYGFVKQSGGAMRIYSEPGQGTMVRLYLPRAVASTEKAAVRTSAKLDTSHGETILLVEDNKMVRQTVARQLVMLGYKVIEAASGDAAAVILQANDRHIDLMLSDVVMPGKLNGYALARLAHELRPDLKIVLTSGFVDGQAGRQEAGYPDPMLLPKPYRSEQLARTLRDALAPKTAPSSSDPPAKSG